MLRGALAIALIALTGSACSVSRSTSSGSRVQEFQGSSVQKDSSRIEREVVAIRDTVR